MAKFQSYERFRLSTISQALYRQEHPAFWGDLAASMVIFIFLYLHTRPGLTYFLFFSWGAWSILRYWLSIRFEEQAENLDAYQLKRWVLLHRVMSFVNCVHFSIGIYLISISNAPECLWLATIGGVLYAFGTFLTVSWDLGSLLSTIPINFSTLIWIQAGKGSLFTVAAIVVLFVFALYSVNELQRFYMKSISLAWENMELAQRIAQEKKDVEYAKRQAEMLSVERSRFFAAANHDLRQPLNALLLGLHHLRTTAHFKDADAKAALDISETASQSLAQLLSQLMEVSKIDTASVQRNEQIFGIAPMFAKLKMEFTNEARSKQIRLVFKSTREFTSSDPLLVERILRNLLDNALKYTDAGSIVLACRPLNDKLRIQVWDTGRGIQPSELPRIFDEFYQIRPDESQRASARGMGLGLSIVKRLGNILNCKIRVKSNFGKGSLFEFELPRTKEEPVDLLNGLAEEQPDEQTPAPSLRGRQILILEDDALGLMALQSVLARTQAKIRSFTTIEGAMRYLDETTEWPDVALIDYQIGNKTSESVIQRLIISSGFKTRVIICSGQTNFNVKTNLLHVGVDYLQKPVSVPQLWRLLQEVAEAEA